MSDVSLDLQDGPGFCRISFGPTSIRVLAKLDLLKFNPSTYLAWHCGCAIRRHHRDAQGRSGSLSCGVGCTP
jgi:hypothetical protein